MSAILWVLRALAVLLALRFLLRLLFGQVRPGGAGRGPAPRPRTGGERVGGELVRDPQCGTYVARSRAVEIGSGAGTLYFCSTACRDAYAASHRQ